METSLEQALGRLVELAPAPTSTDPVEQIRTRGRQINHRRRVARTAVGGVGLCAVVVVAVVFAPWRSGDGSRVSTNTPVSTNAPVTTNTPSSTGSVGEIVSLGLSPLAPRTDAAVVAVGGKVLVWGGRIEGENVGHPERGLRTVYDDGAAYDVQSGTWAALEPAPLQANYEGHPIGLRVDDTTALIASGATVATWSASTQRWTELTPAPTLVRVAASDGSTVVIGGDTWAALDVASDTWTSLPAPEVPLGPGGTHALVSVGRSIVLVTVQHGTLQGASLDLETRAWTPLPSLRLESTTQGIAPSDYALAAAVKDGDVSVLTDKLSAATFDVTTKSWKQNASPELPRTSTFPSLAATNIALVGRYGDAVIQLVDQGWRLIGTQSNNVGLTSDGRVVYSFDFVAQDATNTLARIDPS